MRGPSDGDDMKRDVGVVVAVVVVVLVVREKDGVNASVVPHLRREDSNATEVAVVEKSIFECIIIIRRMCKFCLFLLLAVCLCGLNCELLVLNSTKLDWTGLY